MRARRKLPRPPTICRQLIASQAFQLASHLFVTSRILNHLTVVGQTAHWQQLDITKLRGEVELLPLGSLPNDGKVIEDARSYK